MIKPRVSGLSSQCSDQWVRKSRAPLPVFRNVMHEVDSHECRGFLEEWQLHWTCTIHKISGACVDTKLKGIKATCIVSGEKWRSACTASNENLGNDQWTRLVILCARVYENTQQQSRTKISLKACPEDTCWMSENVSKAGGGHLLKGVYYRKVMVRKDMMASQSQGLVALSKVCVAVWRTA